MKQSYYTQTRLHSLRQSVQSTYNAMMRNSDKSKQEKLNKAYVVALAKFEQFLDKVE